MVVLASPFQLLIFLPVYRQVLAKMGYFKVVLSRLCWQRPLVLESLGL